MESWLWVLSTPFVYAHELSPSQYGQSRKLRGLHGRENPPFDCYHSNIRPCVPVPTAWLDARSTLLTKGFACRLSKPNIRIFPTLEPLRVKKATILKDGLFVLMEELASLRVKPQLVGSAVARSPDGRLFIMFGPVITTEAHLAYAGARLHSNNTAELSSIIEALSFLGPKGPCCPRFASLYLLRFQARGQHLLGVRSNHVRMSPWMLTSQRLLLQVQLRLRITVQHIYSHAQNLGNECADHARRPWGIRSHVKSEHTHSLGSLFI